MATYPGGKNGDGTYQRIINLMPPHLLYVEPFLGSGAIMRLKRPSVESIGIDIDAPAIAMARQTMTDIPKLTLICGNAITWLFNNGWSLAKSALLYLDPPYLMETRSSKRALYRHEFATEEEHANLLTIIKKMNCMVMISGYYSDLYANALADWRVVSFQAQTRGGKIATELVWCNFPEPMALHDYRYLGDNYREREKIKRKQTRWRARLARMDSQERYAMLSVLQDPPTANMPMLASSAGSGDTYRPASIG